jgi:hypothetical protein
MAKKPNQYQGHKVKTRDGSQTGEVKGTRRCQMEGCLGVRLRVVWADGHVTYPCTKGMEYLGNDVWRIK